MSVHVVGAGALGSMIAARLSAAGVETRLVLRAKSGRRRAVDATSRVRVLVDGAPHDVAAASDARDAKLVLLCTKVWQARDALRQAKTSAKVVALCNGALSLADDATIVPAVTTHGCFETQPFDVTHAGPGTLWVSDEEAFKTLSAAETLNVVRVSEAEMTERLWKKLAVSCVLNPLTALHSCRNGEALPGRAFATLEGIGLSSDPDYAILKECFPYLAFRLLSDDSPRARGAPRLHGAARAARKSRPVRRLYLAGQPAHSSACTLLGA